jgi:hypothetical protein
MSFRPYDPDYARRLNELAEVFLACRDVTRAIAAAARVAPAYAERRGGKARQSALQ